MAESLAEVLQQHRQSLFAKQAPGFAAGWVFPSRVGRLSTPSAIRKPLARAAASDASRAAGLTRGPSAHWFRHTMSNLLRLHTTGQVQRSVTGHSTEAMSEHYSHVSLDEKRVAIHAVVTSLGTQPGINPGTSRSSNKTAG
jgi:integrase